VPTSACVPAWRRGCRGRSRLSLRRTAFFADCCALYLSCSRITASIFRMLSSKPLTRHGMFCSSAHCRQILRTSTVSRPKLQRRFIVLILGNVVRPVLPIVDEGIRDAGLHRLRRFHRSLDDDCARLVSPKLGRELSLQQPLGVARILVCRLHHDFDESRLVLLPRARSCGKESCKRFFPLFAALVPVVIRAFSNTADDARRLDRAALRQ
jgi:hypothetical protein